MHNSKAATLTAIGLVMMSSVTVSHQAEARGGRGLVGALLGIAISGAIGAATAKPSESQYTNGVLRPPQLKQCLLDAHRIDTIGDQIDSDGASIDADRAIVEVGRDQIARDTFNARVQMYNNQVRAENSDVASWNATCANHQFFVYDLNQIKGDLPFSIDQYIQKS